MFKNARRHALRVAAVAILGSFSTATCTGPDGYAMFRTSDHSVYWIDTPYPTWSYDASDWWCWPFRC